MIDNEIPSWLTVKEEYVPPKDSSNFITKSQKSVVAVMSKFKVNKGEYKTKEANTSLRLFAVLLLIVLTAVAKNYSFVLLMLGITAVRVALLKADKIRALFKVLVPAMIMSLIILLPAVFMGHPKTLLTVLGKVVVSTSLIMSVNLTAPFNSITSALKTFRIPDIIIFTFDFTVKYILILSEICYEMLCALKIRSIGKNNNKKSSASGILGTVFVKAKQSGEETVKAMECRGFCGKYTVTKHEKFKPKDLIYALAVACVAGAFVYFEAVIK